MRKLFSYLAWPVTAGLLFGLILVLATPSLRYALGQQLHHLLPSQNQQPISYADAVSRAAPAVVNIFSRKRINSPRNPLFDDPLFRHFFNSADIPQQQRMSAALGSGVIINKEGYLLTNNHVIADSEEIIVSLYDGREVKAEIIGSDPETDLAVLKIPPKNIQSIVLGEPQKTRIGDVVLAIGNPFSVGQTVTQGIISATGRHGLGINVYENFLQTDAAINPGNSGGALIDAHGKLLGINTAILNNKSSGSGVGIGFAIPADIAVNVMSDIITSGQAIRGWLGIEARTLDDNIIRTYNLQNSSGVMITSIYPNGPADKAGIKVDDIITHINQQPIVNGREGMNLIANVRPNDDVQITISRNNQTQKLKATVGIRPKNL
ncbi:Outer membrane stress sensor protease DegS [gamma proteobacterium IMCC1989]|nr:Outer membrane stress sensor protease DegS [gamma proteobacterium IMCC1989]